jgi:serine/threonine protein kinase
VALSQWRALRALRRQGSSGIVRSSALDRDWVLDRDAVSFKHAIGSGAYGCVYLGTLHETDVAIKMLQGGLPTSGAAAGTSAPPGVAWQQLQELAAEVEVLASLHHPNVVLFMGVILSPPCVVTEFCPMRSLFDVLERAWHEPALAKRLNWPRRLLMALDAARGMLALHEHVVPILHTDLKSPNLFVDNGLRVKVKRVKGAVRADSNGVGGCGVGGVAGTSYGDLP